MLNSTSSYNSRSPCSYFRKMILNTPTFANNKVHTQCAKVVDETKY